MTAKKMLILAAGFLICGLSLQAFALHIQGYSDESISFIEIGVLEESIPALPYLNSFALPIYFLIAAFIIIVALPYFEKSGNKRNSLIAYCLFGAISGIAASLTANLFEGAFHVPTLILIEPYYAIYCLFGMFALIYIFTLGGNSLLEGEGNSGYCARTVLVTTSFFICAGIITSLHAGFLISILATLPIVLTIFALSTAFFFAMRLVLTAAKIKTKTP